MVENLINAAGTVKTDELKTEIIDLKGAVICPGLIDGHIHIESSMVVPSEFARMATPHGTVATVSDPHEIANVMGVEGVKYMISNGKRVPFKFFFGVIELLSGIIQFFFAII
mgnify:CR=1 FL=1